MEKMRNLKNMENLKKMSLYPAIDLKDGKCVRLIQGDYEQVTVFGGHPKEVAQRWEAQGAKFLHLVDLDGAKEGKGMNDEVIKEIVQSITIPVEVGGGIRTLEDIAQKLAIGVKRVILGSLAVYNLDLVEVAIKQFGNQHIVVGVDAKEGKVAIEGWKKVTDIDALDFCRQLEYIGVKTVIYTDIAKDGMMQGPNTQQTKQLVDKTNLEIIASGGISSLEDLEEVCALGVEGAIIGKAIYTKAINLKEAVRQFEKRGNNAQ